MLEHGGLPVARATAFAICNCPLSRRRPRISLDKVVKCIKNDVEPCRSVDGVRFGVTYTSLRARYTFTARVGLGCLKHLSKNPCFFARSVQVGLVLPAQSLGKALDTSRVTLRVHENTTFFARLDGTNSNSVESTPIGTNRKYTT